MHKPTDPDFSNAVLLTIDTQNDFTLPGAPVEIAGTLDIIPTMARLLAAFRARQRPIVHVVRLYLADGSNAELCRRAMIENGLTIVAPGTDGAELVDDLKPGPHVRLDHRLLLTGQFQEFSPNEAVMYKPRWGAFFHTPLEAYLKNRNINTIIFTGCNFPNCPRTSIYQASERDLRIVLVHDAISQLYDRGRAELEGIGVCMLSAQELEQEIA